MLFRAMPNNRERPRKADREIRPSGNGVISGTPEFRNSGQTRKVLADAPQSSPR